MNGRLYDSKLHRFLQPDNYVQDPYNSQNFNRYGYVYNNPLSHVDPSGEVAWFVPMLVIMAKGAAIAGVSYTASVAFSDGGFNNWNWGQFGKSLGIGAVSGVLTAGVGSAFGEVGKFAHEVARGLSHGFVNGTISSVTGGDFMQGFASGALGSLAGSGFQALAGDFAKSAVGTIGFSAVSGGVGAELTGGDFWRGAATGATIGLLNHMQETFSERLAKSAEKRWMERSTEWAKKNGYSQCNVFVHDMMVENGMNPTDYPLNAGEWGNPNKQIPGYKIVNSPRRGDVAAFKYDYYRATGHMGIMRNNMSLVYTNATHVASTPITIKGWGDKNWVFRRYTGK
jgi:hypothetical protein